MESIAQRLAGSGPAVEIVASCPEYRETQDISKDIEGSIVRMIARRPCTISDLSQSLGVEKEKVNLCLEKLLLKNTAIKKQSKRGTFFKLEKRTGM